MKQPSEQQLRAICAMQEMPAWRTVCEWVQACRDQAREANDELEGVKLIQSQGHAQAYNFFLQVMGSARDSLVKVESRRQS